MPLHKSVLDEILPAPLKKKLVFGNREQIDALNALEADINDTETNRAKIAGGDLKYFDVCIEYSGEQNFRILAIDKADAEEKAKEEADQGEADIEVDCVNAREVRPCKTKKTK